MKLQVRFLIVAAMLVSNLSYAACTGKVDSIQQGYNGRISIVSTGLYGDGGARDICRVDTVWNGVPVEACKSWLSSILVAYVAGKKLWVEYGVACSGVGTWESAIRPHAIRLQ